MYKRTCANCIDGEYSSKGIVCRAGFKFKHCTHHTYKYNKGDMCRFCHEEEVYRDLTDGLCLNCYGKLQDDIAEMEREARLDYLDDLM